MTVSTVLPLAREAYALAKHIATLVRQGLDRDEVLARLADPAGVAVGLIDKAIKRKVAGAAYLGISPASAPKTLDDSDVVFAAVENDEE